MFGQFIIKLILSSPSKKIDPSTFFPRRNIVMDYLEGKTKLS